jgi:hypothetical protein
MSYRDGISDADIEAQRSEIKAEVETQPLVGDEEPPGSLSAAYADNAVFLPKIAELSVKYRAIRRSRGDGSCFYRCFLVSLGEAFVSAHVAPARAPGSPQLASVSPLQSTYESVLSHVEGSLDLLLALGYPDSTVPDFQEAMLDYLRGLSAPGATLESAVLAPFRENMSGFYIITYLRMLVRWWYWQCWRRYLTRARYGAGISRTSLSRGGIPPLHSRSRSSLRDRQDVLRCRGGGGRHRRRPGPDHRAH